MSEWENITFIKSFPDRSAIGGWSGFACFYGNIWNNSTWFSLTHIWIRWSSSPFGACSLRVMFPRVDYPDALLPTEAVRASLSMKLKASRCNGGLKLSIDLSLELIHLALWRLTIWQRSSFLRFPCWFLLTLKHSGSFPCGKNQNNIWSAWKLSSALRGPLYFVLNFMQKAITCPIRLKLL